MINDKMMTRIREVAARTFKEDALDDWEGIDGIDGHAMGVVDGGIGLARELLELADGSGDFDWEEAKRRLELGTTMAVARRDRPGRVCLVSTGLMTISVTGHLVPWTPGPEDRLARDWYEVP